VSYVRNKFGYKTLRIDDATLEIACSLCVNIICVNYLHVMNMLFQV
jgi:hypothetical protein